MNASTQKPEKRILSFLQEGKAEMVSYLRRLVLAESPSSNPESQAVILAILRETLRELGFAIEILPGKHSGGQLLARPAGGYYSGKQMLIGHCDTVWPIGSIESMPFVFQDGAISGPGVFDMKGGLTQIVFALKAIRSSGLEPSLEPIVFVNTDEEIGSIESEPHIRRLAQEVERVYVLEPALGLSGKLKTARKGVGQFSITVKGKAAHAGLDPEKGISAIRELSYLIQKLYALSDPSGGVTVNVGIIEGGIRPNVIAPISKAQVDVRVPTMKEARRMESAILNLRPETPGAELEITGRIGRPPMEPTKENQRLWKLARSLGEGIGLKLEQGTAGGGSDGNTTSQYVATLDGLGPVGDGAHAEHEFIILDKMVERCALLALLILAP
ncbi:MAG: M20 family metallopeptidase [Candidatus Promineifilaceae bacterium]